MLFSLCCVYNKNARELTPQFIFVVTSDKTKTASCNSLAKVTQLAVFVFNFMKFHPIADIFPIMSESEFNSFSQDILENGQREPIWVFDNQIVDGRNRYNACLKHGIEPHFIEFQGKESELAKFVVSLNLHRRHLNESQRAMVAAKLANMRQGERTDLSEISERLSQSDSATLLNVSSDLVGYAKKVQQSASPELIGKVQQGQVAVSTAATVSELPKEEQTEIVARGEKEIIAASKRIRAERAKVRRQERFDKIITQTLAFPTGKYAVICADPPYQYNFAESESRDLSNQYPTLTIEAICDLDVDSICNENAVLFLWAMSPKLEEAFQVLNAWGFTYKTCAVWDKEKIGMGYYFRQQHELLLVATKGDIPTPPIEARIGSVIRSSRTLHSQKPPIFYEIIENMFPNLPRIELFARQQREGWSVWGNQITKNNDNT